MSDAKTHNGRQLYGAERLAATAVMGLHRELRRLSWRQKLAVNAVAQESKLTLLGHEVYSNTFTPPFPSRAYDRFMRGLVATGTGTPWPVIVNFALTSRCICRCWHCSFSNRANEEPLSLTELQRAIEAVQQLGTAVIGFTGGEPLLRDDLEEIIASVGPRSTPLLFTTGYGLTAERVRALKRAGLKMPVVSLDHYDPRTHDEGRGIRGMHQRAIAAIRLFKEAGLYTSVSFVPTRALLDDRRAFWRCLDFFRDLGVNDLRLTSPILSGKLTHHPEQALAPQHVRLIFEAQQKCTATAGYPGCFAYDYFENRRFYGCGAGYNYMFIDSQGNVCPCDFTMMSFGSIRERPVAELWRELSSLFHTPGPTCYATKIAPVVLACESESWPLSPDQAREVHRQSPSTTGPLPQFHRGMGFRRG